MVVVRCGAYTVCSTRFSWGSQASRVLSGGLASLLVAEHHESTKPALCIIARALPRARTPHARCLVCVVCVLPEARRPYTRCRVVLGDLVSVLVTEHHEGTKPALCVVRAHLGLAGLARAVVVR